MSEETKVACPRRNSTCVAEITNAKKCNQCGFQFDLDRFPITSAAYRRKEGGWIGGAWEPQE
jgi:hypothetical protein